MGNSLGRLAFNLSGLTGEFTPCITMLFTGSFLSSRGFNSTDIRINPRARIEVFFTFFTFIFYLFWCQLLLDSGNLE